MSGLTHFLIAKQIKCGRVQLSDWLRQPGKWWHCITTSSLPSCSWFAHIAYSPHSTRVNSSWDWTLSGTTMLVAIVIARDLSGSTSLLFVPFVTIVTLRPRVLQKNAKKGPPICRYPFRQFEWEYFFLSGDYLSDRKAWLVPKYVPLLSGWLVGRAKWRPEWIISYSELSREQLFSSPQ